MKVKVMVMILKVLQNTKERYIKKIIILTIIVFLRLEVLERHWRTISTI